MTLCLVFLLILFFFIFGALIILEKRLIRNCLYVCMYVNMKLTLLINTILIIHCISLQALYSTEQWECIPKSSTLFQESLCCPATSQHNVQSFLEWLHFTLLPLLNICALPGCLFILVISVNSSR